MDKLRERLKQVVEIILGRLLDSSFFVSVVVFALIFLIMQSDLVHLKNSTALNDLIKVFVNSDSLILVISLIFLVFSTYSVSKRLFKYLNNDRSEKNDYLISVTSERLANEHNRRVRESIAKALNENPEVLDVENSVYEKVVARLESSLLDKLENRFGARVESDFEIKSISHELQALTNTVERYLDRIQRNSIVNLFIGIVGTTTAILILAFTLLTNRAFSDLQSFVTYFVPRLTFAIFIQLFAFFFLRLYKNNLADAKYFQNELTNLSAKAVSIKVSYLVKLTDNIEEILKDLAKTERNFKLGKDETTIHLENSKLENEIDRTMLEQLKNILSQQKRNV